MSVGQGWLSGAVGTKLTIIRGTFECRRCSSRACSPVNRSTVAQQASAGEPADPQALNGSCKRLGIAIAVTRPPHPTSRQGDPRRARDIRDRPAQRQPCQRRTHEAKALLGSSYRIRGMIPVPYLVRMCSCCDAYAGPKPLAQAGPIRGSKSARISSEYHPRRRFQKSQSTGLLVMTLLK